MIELQNVSVRYSNGVEALREVSVRVDPGEFAFLVGPNGSGKSTLLKLLYREVRPASGTVYVAGRNVDRIRDAQIPHFRRKIGVIFQDYRLLPHKTAWENVAFALQVTGERGRVIKQRVPEILEMVGLAGKAKCFPEQLSGGEQQRVCIARALVHAPPLLVADEPTGNLDPATSWEIFQLLDAIHREGTTIITATHDAAIVNRFQKRVIAFEDGRITRDDHVGGYDLDQDAFFRRIEGAGAVPGALQADPRALAGMSS